MPRVLIVEDEPAAGRYLRALIEQKKPSFSVLGIAADGQKALDSIVREKPDLVITDVKMPILDGIQLVTILKAKFPDLPVIIVSGYGEFEYARRALDTGVMDYLLKPVDPLRLEEVLAKLEARLSLKATLSEADRLGQILEGSLDVEPNPADAESYYLAALRLGALPSRFHLKEARRNPAIRGDGFWSIQVSDARLWVYLGRTAVLNYRDFLAKVREAVSALEGPFRTLLFLPEKVECSLLRVKALGACHEVDKLVAPGLSREFQAVPHQRNEAGWDKAFADRIEFALTEQKPLLLEKALRDIAGLWQKETFTLLAAESQIRPIMHLILRRASLADRDIAAELEFLLDDIFSSAFDYQGLEEKIVDLGLKASGLRRVENASFKSVPAFFADITRYIDEHYAETLSLGLLADSFRISTSYLSKLFRQYAGLSFGEYLVQRRIEIAKGLIRDNPGMLQKEVAERVGFADPFYFSRVFKSIVGIPPSDYSRPDDEAATESGK